ncbi:MAG: phage tail tape measure protein [Ruminococcus sp.]|nr:phage tail tape measure protein [Ruminococcus sp.]
MAETNDGNIEFDVRAKLDKFENDLDDAESMIESTVSRIIGDAGEAQSKLEEKAKELAKAYEEAGMDSADALRKAWADVRNDASESFKNTEDDINESLSGIGESASETGEEISETFEGVSENISDAFEGAEESADSFADNIKNVLAAVGIAYGAKEIVDIGVSYEKAMNKVANATGATNENLEQLKEITENVYSNNFGESMEDVASGVSEIYKRTGLVGDELQKVTESAYVLQDAFEYELNESTQAATQIMSSFGTTAEEAYNLIAQGAQKGLDQNGDMLDVINEYSVQFADMGYSAEDMFNMLANGVQNGVWSVDKLGDAIKEMHIRLSDGTADEALQALKLGFAESAVDANELEKSALNLSKAEVSFSQAQQAVDEALSKSGSSSLEYQDALNKAKQAELDLKDAQEEYNTVASTTEYNLDAIKDKLSAGGEDAKEAIQDIMTALSQVEDEQERYVLGQTIMGTMWEDLGEDAVNALMNTQGEISKTKDSLSEISEIQYDDLGTKLSALQRKIETEVVLPIAKKAVPKIEKAIEYVAENLDEIIDKAKPVAAGIATAFAITKVVEFGSTAVKVAKTVKGAFTVSNLTNPLGWIALGVTAVAALASAAKKQSEEWKKHLEDVREEAAKIPDELQKSIDSTKECVDEWENLKKQSKETKLGEDIDFNNIKDLEESLLSLINADGTIKTGAETKVTELIDEINQYSDTALTVSDGVILKNDEVVGSYDKIAESIDAVIEKQHAQNYLDALSDMSKEAQLAQPKLQENIATENKHLKEYKSEREKILQEMAQLRDEYGADDVGEGNGIGGSRYKIYSPEAS